MNPGLPSRPRWRALLLPTLLALVLLAAGCTGSGPQPAASDEPIHYVAMGDSFTSGPGLGQVSAGGAVCGRSPENYPAHLARWLAVDSVVDVSCAGASTDAVVNPQVTVSGAVVSPQVDALSAETTLVTMGFGANDLLVYAGIIGCRTAGAPCFIDETTADATRVRPLVAAAVDEVQEAAPDARVHVIGYPQILPADAGCLDVTAPPELLHRLADATIALNTAVRKGAEDAGAAYVDLWTPSQGHHVCAGEEAWISGDAVAGGAGAPYHWNAAGMRAAAGVVHQAITGEEPPAD
jgi:hypothetical protein